MPTPTVNTPTDFELSNVRIGQPVSTGGLLRVSNELGYLIGYNVNKVGETTITKRVTPRTILRGLTYSVPMAYSRSSGCQVVRIGVTLWDQGEQLDDYQNISVTLPTGATWLAANGLDGTRDFYNPAAGRTQEVEYSGWVDVSGVTISDPDTFFLVNGTPTSKGEGIKRVTITECPLAAFDVVSTEPGWDAAATTAGRLVIDGQPSGPGSPRGTDRIFYLIDKARKDFKKHFQICSVESADATGAPNTPHWYRENGVGIIDFLTNGAHNPGWYMTTRNLYGGTTSPYNFRVRYRTSGATGGDIGLYAQKGTIISNVWTPSVAPSLQILTLPGTSGAWAWAKIPVNLPIGSMIKLYFDSAGPGAGQLLSFSNIALVENEL